MPANEQTRLNLIDGCKAKLEKSFNAKTKTEDLISRFPNTGHQLSNALLDAGLDRTTRHETIKECLLQDSNGFGRLGIISFDWHLARQPLSNTKGAHIDLSDLDNGMQRRFREKFGNPNNNGYAVSRTGMQFNVNGQLWDATSGTEHGTGHVISKVLINKIPGVTWDEADQSHYSDWLQTRSSTELRTNTTGVVRSLQIIKRLQEVGQQNHLEVQAKNESPAENVHIKREESLDVPSPQVKLENSANAYRSRDPRAEQRRSASPRPPAVYDR